MSADTRSPEARLESLRDASLMPPPPPPPEFLGLVRRRARARLVRQACAVGGLGVLATTVCLTLMLVLAGSPPTSPAAPQLVARDPKPQPLRRLQPTVIALNQAADRAGDLDADLPGSEAGSDRFAACERDLRIGSAASRETLDCLSSL